MKGRGKRGKGWEGGERRRILEASFLAGGGGGVRTSWFEAKSKAKKPDKRLIPRISHLAVASSLFKLLTLLQHACKRKKQHHEYH